MSPPLAQPWAVGSPGEFNWKLVYAVTETRARELFIEDYAGAPCKGCTPDDCECVGELSTEPLADMASAEEEGVDYMPLTEAKARGWGHVCDRCGHESDDWTIIGDVGVCMGCTTPEEAPDYWGDEADA